MKYHVILVYRNNDAIAFNTNKSLSDIRKDPYNQITACVVVNNSTGERIAEYRETTGYKYGDGWLKILHSMM
jgi:hypothetical protein